jgi:hypothetical protein
MNLNSHGYNTRNSQLPRLPKPSTDWDKKPMPQDIFKRKLNMFLIRDRSFFIRRGGAGGFCRGATRKNSDVKGGSPQEN